MKDTQVGSRQLHHYLKPGSSKQKVAVAAIFEGWEEGGKREKRQQYCKFALAEKTYEFPKFQSTTWLLIWLWIYFDFIPCL